MYNFILRQIWSKEDKDLVPKTFSHSAPCHTFSRMMQYWEPSKCHLVPSPSSTPLSYHFTPGITSQAHKHNRHSAGCSLAALVTLPTVNLLWPRPGSRQFGQEMWTQCWTIKCVWYFQSLNSIKESSSIVQVCPGAPQHGALHGSPKGGNLRYTCGPAGAWSFLYQLPVASELAPTAHIYHTGFVFVKAYGHHNLTQ